MLPRDVTPSVNSNAFATRTGRVTQYYSRFAIKRCCDPYSDSRPTSRAKQKHFMVRATYILF